MWYCVGPSIMGFLLFRCAVLCAAAFFEILSIEKATVCPNGFTCMSFWVFNNTSFDLFYVVVFFFFLDFVSHLMRRSCTFRQWCYCRDSDSFRVSFWERISFFLSLSLCKFWEFKTNIGEKRIWLNFFMVNILLSPLTTR